MGRTAGHPFRRRPAPPPTTSTAPKQTDEPRPALTLATSGVASAAFHSVWMTVGSHPCHREASGAVRVSSQVVRSPLTQRTTTQSRSGGPWNRLSPFKGDIRHGRASASVGGIRHHGEMLGMGQQRRSVIRKQHRPEFDQPVQTGIRVAARVGMRVVQMRFVGFPLGFSRSSCPAGGTN